MKTKEPKHKITLFHLRLYRGGGERVLVDIARGLVESGVSVDFILMQGGGAYLKTLPPSVRVVEFNTRRILGTLPRLVWYLKRERPEALLAITKHTHLIALWAKLLSRVDTKIVLRIGIPFSLFFKKGKGLRETLLPYFIQWFYPKADAFIAVSKGVADDLVTTVDVSPDKISVIYNPKPLSIIENESQEHVSHAWFRNKEKPIVLAAGRLRPQKDFRTLIKAFACVLEYADARLVIMGGGDERQSLEALVAEKGLSERIAFLGAVDNPYAHMARADVFVLPSLWEGFPNVLVEAMASGVPVISTDCPFGPREILAPNTKNPKNFNEVERASYGLLTPVGNVHLLAQGICLLLSDTALAERLKEAGKVRVKEFDIDCVLKEYKSVLLDT